MAIVLTLFSVIILKQASGEQLVPKLIQVQEQVTRQQFKITICMCLVVKIMTIKS